MVKGFVPRFFLNLLDVIFISRPIIMIPVWGFCAFGYCAGTRMIHGFSFLLLWHTPWSVAFWIGVFSFSVGAVYALNQIADKKVDTYNNGFALLVKGGVPVWCAWITVVLFSLVSIIFPLFFRPILSVFSLAAMFLGILYSCRPTYFSGRPFLDFITNATGYGLVSFAVGWVLSGATLDLHALHAALPYFFMMCAGSISSTIPDLEGDKTCHKTTTTVLLGKQTAHVLATMFLVIAIADSFFLFDTIALACSAISLPLYIVYLIYKTDKAMESTYKIGCLICMIIGSIVFPYLGPATAITVVATMLYFRLRHRVLYPSLVPVSDEK
jgi:4-hydroxybenzoate polyprenyltransferase